MRLKGKTFLIGLFLVILSIGGVFATWVFNDAPTLEANKDIGSETYPSRKWEFEDAALTFNAGTFIDSEGNEYQGQFNDGSIEKNMNNPKPQCLDYEEYKNLITSSPKLYDLEGNEYSSYVFAYWGYYEDDELKVFHFDKSIQNDMELTAVYTDVNNPTIYKSNDLSTPIATMFLNPKADNEYMLANFVVDQAVTTNNVYRGYYYLIKYNENGSLKTLNCISSVDNYTDYVGSGTYTIYFRFTAPGQEEWNAFGGKSYFQRQYKYVLMGNPNNGWDLTVDTPVFGYISEKTNTSGNVVKTYQLNKILFRDDYSSYDFKPYEPYFGIWPHIKRDDTTDTPYLSIGTSTYIRQHSDTSNDNLEFISSVSQRIFDVTIDVTYGASGTYNDVYVPAEYPIDIKVNLKPSTNKVTFYTEDKVTEYKTIEVNYSEKLSEDVYNDFPTSSGIIENVGDKFVPLKWVDVDTGAVVDFANITIMKDQYVYPIYEYCRPTAIIKFVNNYNLSTNSFDTAIFETVYLYKDEKLSSSVINSMIPNSVTSNGTTYNYTFDGWTLDLNTKMTVDELSNVEFSGGNEYTLYPRMIGAAYTDSTTHIIPNIEVFDIAVTSSSIKVGPIVYGTSSLTSSTTKSLITSSGVYRIWGSNTTWNVTRKVGFELGTSDDKYWSNDGARFALYAFNSSSDYKWYSMYSESSTRYNVYIDIKYKGIIYCRMNGSNTTNDWNNKWNQSADVILSTSGYSSTKVYGSRKNVSTWWDSWSPTFVA